MCVLLSKDSKNRVMKVEACQLVLEPLGFLSSPTISHPGDFMDDFKGKRVLSSKWCSILKTEKFLPPKLILTSPMWERQPWVYSKSGKLIFCIENFYDSLPLGTVSLFHIFGVKSDKTTQQYFLSISSSSWTRLWRFCLCEIWLDVCDDNEPALLCFAVLCLSNGSKHSPLCPFFQPGGVKIVS